MAQDPRTASSIIHIALLGGQLAFAAIAIMIERSVAPPEGLSADLLLTINLFVTLSSIAASIIVGNMLVRTAQKLQSESDRMSAALRAFIVRMAILEAAGLIAIASYLFTGEQTFLGIFAVVLASFLLLKPKESEWEQVQQGTMIQPHQ